MNTNEQNARINQLLKLYDEAKTTDAEEAELADFFHTATDIPEEWQDYAVLFSTLEAADTLFIDNESVTRPNKISLRWTIGIAAAIIVVAGLFLWSYNTTEEVLPNRSKADPPYLPFDTSDYVTGPPAPVAPHEVRHQMEEVKETTMEQPKPSERLMGKEEAEKSVGGYGSGTHMGPTVTFAEPTERLSEPTVRLSEPTVRVAGRPVRFGALPTGSTTKGFGGGYVGGTYLRGLTTTFADSMLIGWGAGDATSRKKGRYIIMRGYLTDEERQPIANAKIIVVGTPEPVYTDKNGFFEARLNNALRLQVVCEGYETKQNIKPKKKMKIKLKRINN